MTAPSQFHMRAPLAVNGSEGAEVLTGFQVWAAPPQPAQANFDIVGDDYSQVLEIKLNPNQIVTAEPRSMLFMSSGMALDADMGGIGQACKRCCCAGESMFRLHLKNTTAEEQKVALTPSFPARIVPIDLAHHSGLIFNRGAFLGALGTDWRVDIRSVASPGVCCCAGQGLFLNTLHGSGMVFLNAGGTVMKKQLAPGEEIIIDKHSLLAFEKTVNVSIRRTGGCMVCCCAGQGLFNTVLTGPGFVMTHSMSLSKLRTSLGRADQSQSAKAGRRGVAEGLISAALS